MTFISTEPADTDFIEAHRSPAGDVANYVAVFAARPEVFQAWEQLSAAIQAGMDPRRYELVTLAAATTLRSSYCSLAHGKVLAEEHHSPAEVVELAQGHSTDATDRAVMAFARKVVVAADRIDQSDVDQLTAHGLTDTDVIDIVLAAAARCFFAKTLDATGTTPDAKYHQLPTPLRTTLTVGRPIDPA